MKAAKESYINDLKNKAGTKHVHYKAIKDCDKYEMEKYMVILENFYDRQILAQMRTGSNFLEIELGRRNGTAHDERLCKCCSAKEVEDEYHFVYRCEAYKDIRAKYPGLFAGHQNMTTFFKGDTRKITKFLLKCRDHRSTVFLN
jgi:hypothetical protein